MLWSVYEMSAPEPCRFTVTPRTVRAGAVGPVTRRYSRAATACCTPIPRPVSAEAAEAAGRSSRATTAPG